jgi:hypothetical protein
MLIVPLTEAHSGVCSCFALATSIISFKALGNYPLLFSFGIYQEYRRVSIPEWILHTVADSPRCGKSDSMVQIDYFAHSEQPICSQ